MRSQWKIEVYRNWEEVDDSKFLNRWMDLLQSATDANVFAHPALIRTWTDIYRKQRDISPLYCIAESDNATIFLPLVMWRRNWKNAFIRSITPSGYSDYDYHDPLIVGDLSTEMMQLFWQSLFDAAKNGVLGSFDTAEFSGIRITGKQCGWKQSDNCHYADLRRYEDFEQMLSSLSKNLRKDIKKRKRQLNNLGKITFHVYENSELNQVLEDFPVFMREHGKKWPGAYKAPGFHESLLKNAFHEGLVHYSQLRIDDRPISWELGFRYRDKAYSYMPVYLDYYRKYSPGKIHLSYLLEDGIKKGIGIFDFMRGDESYKKEWTSDQFSLYRYDMAGRGLSSLMRNSAQGVLTRIKNKASRHYLFVLLLSNYVQEVLVYQLLVD
jgi:CelD/BcsL family acetyltransferase involved in cellulose biosynthesis